MAATSPQYRALRAKHLADIKCIEKCYHQEISKWKNDIKLLILAEAPTSCKKYFYNKNCGNLLTSLRKFFNLPDNKKLLVVLRKKGILVLDIYELPLDPTIYNADAKSGHYDLFDLNYFCGKLIQLTKAQLLTRNTRIVFRYKKLIDRYLVLRNRGMFSDCDFHNTFLLEPNGKPARLNSREKRGEPVILNEVVKNYLYVSAVGNSQVQD